MPLPVTKTNSELNDLWIRLKFNDSLDWRDEFINMYNNFRYVEEALPPIGAILPINRYKWANTPEAVRGMDRRVTAFSTNETTTYPISSRWKACDGTIVGDADSPFDRAHVPALNDDAVFIAGIAPSTTDTDLSNFVGGRNSLNKSSLLPGHTHSMSHTHSSPAHAHSIGDHRHTVPASSVLLRGTGNGIFSHRVLWGQFLDSANVPIQNFVTNTTSTTTELNISGNTTSSQSPSITGSAGDANSSSTVDNRPSFVRFPYYMRIK